VARFLAVISGTTSESENDTGQSLSFAEKGIARLLFIEVEVLDDGGRAHNPENAQRTDSSAQHYHGQQW